MSLTRTWIRPALALLITGAVAAPALAHVPPPPGGGCRLIRGAETPDNSADDVSVCRQDVYFHKGSAPVGNLAETGQATLPSWSTTKPDGFLHEAGISVSSAEYDLLIEEGAAGGRAQWAGTFTGPIDTLGMRLFVRSPVDEVDGGAIAATVYLEVDGQVVYDNYDGEAVSLEIQGTDEPLAHIDATFHDLYPRLQALGVDVSPTKEHTIKLGVAGTLAGSDAVFVYDADEAQSGLYFNLEPASMTGFTKIDPAT